MTEPLGRPGSRLAHANKYLNLCPPAPRRFGFAYLAWLRVGAVGYEPGRPRGFSKARAEALKINLHNILGADPFTAVKEVAL